MASTSDIARRYFAALAARDVDAAVACWRPGGIDNFVGQQQLVAPDGVHRFFTELFRAFPDFVFEIVELTTYRDRTAVRWRAEATFAGPGMYEGFAPNGARATIEGCDVVRIEDEQIVRNDAYFDSGSIARQLGFLPENGSAVQLRMAKLANAGTKLKGVLQGFTPPELIAEGVWLVRGGFPGRTMNVYLIRDGDGVTVFDAGIADMAASVALAAAGLGGAKRVVLGHADCDHRGAAPSLGVPVLCHERELEAARSPNALRPYWQFDELPPGVRATYRNLLLPHWDGGAVEIADTVKEGDRIAGFEVVELPGHAPGLIGLWRASDRLALCSDCLYTIDPITAIKGGPRVPHRAFNDDILTARDSIAKLAELDPNVVWAGHANPVTGAVRAQLERVAAGVV